MSAVAVSEQTELLTKQAALVTRLAATAQSQQRILAHLSANYQDFEANGPSLADGHRVKVVDSETRKELAAVTEAAHISATRNDQSEKDPSTAKSGWASQLVQPSGWDSAAAAARDASLPTAATSLEHVYGYRSVGCRDNIAMIDEDTMVYHVAGVGIVESISNNRQRHFRGHDDEIICLDYNPLRRTVATGQVGRQARVCVWRVDDPTGDTVLEAPFSVGVAAVAISADGSLLVGVGLDDSHTLQVIHIESGRVLASQPTGGDRIVGVAWSADPRGDANANFVTVGDKHITFWHLSPAAASHGGSASSAFTLSATPAALGRLGELQLFTSVASTPEATYVGCDNGALYIFNENKLVRTIDAHNGAVLSINARPAAAELLTGGRDGFANVWEEGSLNQVATIDFNSCDRCRGLNSVRAISVNPRDDGSAPYCSLIVGTAAGSIYKVTGEARKPSAIVVSHFGDLAAPARGGEVAGLATHPSQQIIATAGSDCSLRLWDLSRRRQTHRADFRHSVSSCSFSGDGTRIAVGLVSGTVALCNGRNLITLCSSNKSSSAVTSLQFSPVDATQLAVGYADGALAVFAVEGDKDSLGLLYSCRPLAAEEGGNAIAHIDWSEDASLLRVNGQRLSLSFVSAADGSSVGAADAAAVSFATHTCPLAWESQGVWPTGKSLSGSEVSSVSATKGKSGADSQWIAAAEESGVVSVYNFPCVGSGVDRESERLSARPQGVHQLAHGARATNVRFTFDGSKLISTGGSDCCVMQWSMA